MSGKKLNTHAQCKFTLLPMSRSVPGAKSQQSPAFRPQACYPRGPARMKKRCFVWKKILTRMLNFNSRFFHLSGRFRMPISSNRLHSAFRLATRELLPVPSSGLLPENSCRNDNVVLRLEKNVNTHAQFKVKLLPIDRSVSGTKSQQSPSCCLQACYPRAPAGMKMCCCVWKKTEHTCSM